MKPVHLRTTVVLFLSLSGFTETSLASDVVSPRLRRVQNAVEAWQASGGREPLVLPEHLSPAVENLVPEKGQLATTTADALKNPLISVICRTTDPEILRMSGATVRTVAGQVVTAEIPLSLLDQLDSMPGMISADVPQRYHPLLDVSRPEIRADVAHGGGQPPYSGTTGQGVVVGVIDTGLDTDHPDFLNANGTTRLLYLWDQTDPVGPHPAFPYNYGTEWTAANINASTSREIDTDGHGTHVTGIAAGNGRAIGNNDQFQFTGIAPEADIIFVKTTFAADDILDAVKWIQQKAGAKPCVINLSLGSQYGGHDGTADLDVAMAALSGPGRIIVAAAGNEGNSGIHAQATVPAMSTVDLSFTIPSYTATPGNNSNQGNDLCLVEAFSTNSSFNTSVILPNSTTVGPVGTSGTLTQATTSGEVDIDASAVGSERSVYIDLWDKNATYPPAIGTWTVRVQNTQASPHEIDLWIYYVDLGAAYVIWGSNIDNTELVSSPASSDSVIAVGAYITKTSWPCIASQSGMCGYVSPPQIGDIAPFSSPGPLRDGTTKPEITAPGMGIASSLSKDASGPLFTNPAGEMPGGVRYISQGTSQASPHIAGVAALILEQRPNAAYKEIATALEGTARHDNFTGPGFTTDFGYGKVDAAAAVDVFVPVRLLSLTAGWDGGLAIVRWELRETEEGASFRVDRAPTQAGPFTAQTSWFMGGLSFSWTDPSPSPAEPWYRVVSLDRTGAQQTLGTVSLSPQRMIARLLPNAPNPFQASTKIAFDLDRTGKVRLDVLDISGRLVTTLASGVRSAGRNEIEWNGLDGTGHRVAPGIYVYRLTTPDRVLARRMVMTS
jgi:subtilisin family serine protease